MSFATVKSDPFKKKAKKPRLRFQLWSKEFWKKLVDANTGPGLNERQFQMIRQENVRLYGA